MVEVDVRQLAAAHADGALVIDVREPYEYASGHVPGAVPIPLHDLGQRLFELPSDQPLYVICASGARSLAAAHALRRAGFDARSVAGGTTAWRRAGHPLATQSQAA